MKSKIVLRFSENLSDKNEKELRKFLTEKLKERIVSFEFSVMSEKYENCKFVETINGKEKICLNEARIKKMFCVSHYSKERIVF
jgi:hypothetical protein